LSTLHSIQLRPHPLPNSRPSFLQATKLEPPKTRQSPSPDYQTIATCVAQEHAKQGRRNREGAAQNERVPAFFGSAKGMDGESRRGCEGRIVRSVRPTMSYHNLISSLFHFHARASEPPTERPHPTYCLSAHPSKPSVPTPHVQRSAPPSPLPCARYGVPACDNRSGEAFRRRVGYSGCSAAERVRVPISP
jgi:hypothetical protein